jgi:Tfp pilus assembly protein PilF
VAGLRGQLEDAAASYLEAARLAPDRAVPRAALGGVQLRLGRPELALASFDEALALSPADDAGLLGRAQALVVLERPDDAAATFDRLADARRAAGRPADAGDAFRRAIEIQPTAARRERYQALVDELRQQVGDAGVERALARALRFLASAPEPNEPPVASPAAEALEAGAALPAPPRPDVAVDGDVLLVAADEAAARGDGAGVVASVIAAARAFRAAGHAVAALDACDRGLAARPDDVGLHLLIAELRLERGALGPAGDTYRKLLRLADIDGDAVARERVLAAALQAFPNDPGFAPGA